MPADVLSPRLLGATLLLTGLSLALSAGTTSDRGRSHLGRRERIGAGTVQSFLTLDRRASMPTCRCGWWMAISGRPAFSRATFRQVNS